MPVIRRQPRPDIDPTARRYYVYRLWSTDGEILYVGRSSDPVRRLQAHRGWDGVRRVQGSDGWAGRVSTIDAWGPYTWAEAVKHERDAIKKMRPLHNIMHAS